MQWRMNQNWPNALNPTAKDVVKTPMVQKELERSVESLKV